MRRKDKFFSASSFLHGSYVCVPSLRRSLIMCIYSWNYLFACFFDFPCFTLTCVRTLKVLFNGFFFSAAAMAEMVLEMTTEPFTITWQWRWAFPFVFQFKETGQMGGQCEYVISSVIILPTLKSEPDRWQTHWNFVKHSALPSPCFWLHKNKFFKCQA